MFADVIYVWKDGGLWMFRVCFCVFVCVVLILNLYATCVCACVLMYMYFMCVSPHSKGLLNVHACVGV